MVVFVILLLLSDKLRKKKVDTQKSCNVSDKIKFVISLKFVLMSLWAYDMPSYVVCRLNYNKLISRQLFGVSVCRVLFWQNTESIH